MNAYEDVIAAFLDDERVDATMLKEALALPEGREYLVQLLALRGLMNAEGRDGITTRTRAAGSTTGAPRSWDHFVGRWAVAAGGGLRAAAFFDGSIAVSVASRPPARTASVHAATRVENA